MTSESGPRRIASLLAGATEILYAMGLGDRVVAVSHECDYPDDVRAKPRVTRVRLAVDGTSEEIDQQVKSLSAAGAALYEIDTDLLGRLGPELIVTQAHCEVCAVSHRDVARAVATLPSLCGAEIVALNPSDLDDLFEDIQRVAIAARVPHAGTGLVGRLRDRIGAVEAITSRLAAAGRPRVAFIEWADPLMVAANWMPRLIELAGGTSPLTRAGERSAYTSWDDLLACDPEVLIVAPCGFDFHRALRECEALQTNPMWKRLLAARPRRVYAADGNAYFNRSGPRLIDSLEMLAHMIHPERFAPVAAGSWRRL